MFEYPPVERDDSNQEQIFGVNVSDPYRYLEDPKSDKTNQFVKDQNRITEPYLERCPYRSKIKDALSESQNYERYSCPFKRGEKYYFFKNTGLQPQSVMYQQDSLESEPKVFFDPNTLSDDGTVSLTTFSFSPNHQYFAYALSSSGSDWLEIKVKDVSSGQLLSDKILQARSTSIEWTHDNKGFFYARFPHHTGEAKGTETESNTYHSLFYHLLNTNQSEDILQLNFPDNPAIMIATEISDDGQYLWVFPREGCSDNSWFYYELKDFNPVTGKLPIKPIYEKLEAQFEYLANNGKTVYFRTNLDAKNYRIAKLSLDDMSKEHWTDVVKSHETDVLDWAEVYTIGSTDYILLNYMRKVVYYLELHKLEGELVKKFITPSGTISKHSGRRDDGEIFFQFTSFLTPGQTFHFDLNKLDEEAKIIRQTKPNNFDSEDYNIDQVFYESYDKVLVPMFIVYRKDIKLDGKNPCILYGYGGFNIQITSTFNINRIMWLKNFKGIFAVANIRGGGELGQNWHDSGRLLNKQNCFQDFIAAAEYLINKNYTSRDKLAIEGGSNGGLLVAAVANQRPDLIGASLCHVGVLDMLRFAKFTVGHCWVSDFGDPKEKIHFDNLIKFSPYHNIPNSVEYYPATLLLTADHDDRVVPAHSLKFIAQLQYKLGKKLPETPLLIRIETKAGHGAGRPISKIIALYADIYSFLYSALKLENNFTL